MPKSLKLLLLLALCLSACSPKMTSGLGTVTETIAENKILFLSLEVNKSNPTPTFKVINHTLADGRIKKSVPTSIDTPHYFKIVFNSSSGKIINQIAVENPLNRSVEVSNENGTFSRQQIDLDKASLAIRIQYLKKISSISIFDESGKLLSTLDVSI